jgi:uncharacterized membrane protein
MAVLILGIIVFLGVHSFAMSRESRAKLVDRYGEMRFKSNFALLSVLGLVLIVWGFSLYRQNGLIQIWYPPEGMRHLTILLMWLAFIALAAMNPRPGKIRGLLRHPMLVAIKIWALAHLLINGDLGGMILFGSFLAWAVVDRIAVKKRGDLGAPRVAAFTGADALVLGIGTLAFVAMIALHPILIGVPVIG